MVWVVSLLCMKLSPHTLTRKASTPEFGVWLGVLGLRHEIPFSALPPVTTTLRLYLDIFRRKPAIAGFDYNFSANHNSSQHVERCLGAGLRYLLQ